MRKPKDRVSHLILKGAEIERKIEFLTAEKVKSLVEKLDRCTISNSPYGLSHGLQRALVQTRVDVFEGVIEQGGFLPPVWIAELPSGEELPVDGGQRIRAAYAKGAGLTAVRVRVKSETEARMLFFVLNNTKDPKPEHFVFTDRGELGQMLRSQHGDSTSPWYEKIDYGQGGKVKATYIARAILACKYGVDEVVLREKDITRLSRYDLIDLCNNDVLSTQTGKQMAERVVKALACFINGKPMPAWIPTAVGVAMRRVTGTPSKAAVRYAADNLSTKTNLRGIKGPGGRNLEIATSNKQKMASDIADLLVAKW